MSTWFVLCTTFASLFIVTGKRYAELRELGEDAAQPGRRSTTTRSATCASCSSSASARRWSPTAIWAFETAARSPARRWPFYELSIVPMLIALLRYLLVLEQGHGAAPEEIFARRPRAAGHSALIWLVVYGLRGRTYA